MTQRNVRGFYTDFAHDRAQDWDFYRAWQPNVMHLMVHGSHTDPNSVSVDLVRRVHDTSPDTIILLRCWDVDDRNGEAKHAMAADPLAEAEKQISWWARVIDRCTAAGVPRDLLMAGMNNETPSEMDGALYAYTERALARATSYGFKLGIYAFSVGRPSLPGEGQAYDIAYFERIELLLKANRGALLLNEYMQPEGMYGVWVDETGATRNDWPYLMGRHLSWAMDVPIIIGEWGLDGILYNRHRDPKYGHNGWLGFPDLWPPTRYADEYVAYIQVMSANVIAVCGFKNDSNDHTWDSFDFLSAHAALLERKHLCVRQAGTAPTNTTHLPIIGSGPTTSVPFAVSITEAGARIRSYHGVTSTILGAVPHLTLLAITGINPAGTWYRVESPFGVGWVSGTVVAVHNVAGVPVVESSTEDAPTQPEPSVPVQGDNWQRSREFVRRWEGGYQNNPADIGNWTECEVGKGENKGTKFGISACSYPELDIQNLSMEEATAIYERDYWRASGADKLPWPYCLLVFDTAVLHGVGAARKWQEEVGENPYAFAAKRLRVYTKLGNWSEFGAGWVNRVSDLLEVAA